MKEIFCLSCYNISNSEQYKKEYKKHHAWKNFSLIIFCGRHQVQDFVSCIVHSGHCCGKVAEEFVLNEFGLWLFEDILCSWSLFSDYLNLFQCCVKKSWAEEIDEVNFLILTASDHEPKKTLVPCLSLSCWPCSEFNSKNLCSTILIIFLSSNYQEHLKCHNTWKYQR